jgi:hypothetical protein
MSIRCKILIEKGGDIQAVLYRHSDGYIEGVGLDLVKALMFLVRLKTPVTCEDLLSLLPDDYVITRGMRVDIAYFYTIRFTDTNIKLWVAKRHSGTCKGEEERKLYSYKYEVKNCPSCEELFISEQEFNDRVSLYSSYRSWKHLEDKLIVEKKN